MLTLHNVTCTPVIFTKLCPSTTQCGIQSVINRLFVIHLATPGVPFVTIRSIIHLVALDNIINERMSALMTLIAHLLTILHVGVQ